LLLTSTDASVREAAQRACKGGIKDASVVCSSLDCGARAALHKDHEGSLAAAGRALEIAPQCPTAQEMQATALLGLHCPSACVAFCESVCLRPRGDPFDDHPWPPPPGSPPLSPVQATLGMASGVARRYATALRGSGKGLDAMAALQALRCRDPSLEWCLEDLARWDLVGRLRRDGIACSGAGEHRAAAQAFTQVI
ncbi:unnamed protein product, partial [Discosporangium mesarthrocarpum]